MQSRKAKVAQRRLFITHMASIQMEDFFKKDWSGVERKVYRDMIMSEGFTAKKGK